MVYNDLYLLVKIFLLLTKEYLNTFVGLDYYTP